VNDVTPMSELRRVLDTGAKGGSLSMRQGSAEMDYLMARTGLAEQKDLRHGLDHLSCLLALDPAHEEWNALLAEYERAHGGDLETLIPTSEQRFFAHEALRAWCRARRGELDPAVRLLCDVVRAKPSANYLETWALDWLERPGAVEDLTPETAALLFMNALPRFSEAKALTATRLDQARRFAALVARYLRARASTPELAMAACGLHRKAGLFDEGLALARSAVQQAPGWHSHVAEGLLLRQAGRPDEAEPCFRRAAALDPKDVTALLELGDTWFDLERWDKAAAVYEEVLAREPGHAWATASLVWCRAPKLSDALDRLAKAGNRRAQSLRWRQSWYAGSLPAVSDATAKALRHASSKGSTLKSLALSDVEAPSNLVAAALVFPGVRIDVAYSHVATPDPREPVAPVAHVLWKRDGDVLVPAVDPPPPDVLAHIAELATGRYDAELVWARASRLARQLGPSSARALLACVVHPPPLPPERDAFDWVFRVQHTVACTLAHLDAGWDGSARRAALMSLLHGPRDWSTEAAIVALAWLAREQPWIALDVYAAFLMLDRARPSSGGVCYEAALLHFWSGLPGMFPAERDELGQRLAASG